MQGKVSITPGAAQVVRSLKGRYGPLMFHISGGCCEGTAPMCFRAGEFRVGSRDELIGEVESCPVFVGAAQRDYWRDSEIEIGIVEGEVESFSIEAPDGVRFTTQSRPVIGTSPGA